MPLIDRIRVARRFQRSVRIDTDLADPAALEGFVCPPSFASVLQTMARHVAETDHAAFTWTGPYGTGKSSLAVVLSAVLHGQAEFRHAAAVALGPETADALCRALPPRTRGWRILPVIGRRERPAQVVGEAVQKARLVRNRETVHWHDNDVLDTLLAIAKRNPRTAGGLIVCIDEMGKFLEGAAHEGTDIHFFQQLAEMASRSRSRLLVIGILHQAFDEYAHRLAREVRDEWAKIQGRFVDLAINVGADEQLDLLGRAIESDHRPDWSGDLAMRVAHLIGGQADPATLAACWPLHPITACLLGPISRRRFGQNQRSLFGFLNSTEPQGFQDFLQQAPDDALYTPHLLWSYLQLNLEPSIMASPDSHRWALVTDALERCRARSGDELHLHLLQAVGLVDLFRERSGLVASLELLELAFPDCTAAEIRQAMAELQDWSLVVHRKFSDGYSIFEGSDFDIEQAVSTVWDAVGELDCIRLTALAGTQPVIAKRHYHETGALRWYETVLVPLAEAEETVAGHVPQNGAIGTFFLVLPPQGISSKAAADIASRAAAGSGQWDVAVGLPRQTTWNITALAQELMVLEQIRNDTPALQGDRVARMEVGTRIADLKDQIESSLTRAWASSAWIAGGGGGRIPAPESGRSASAGI